MRSLNIIAVTAFAAVAIAGTLAAVDASAAQRFGRDSVYAWDHPEAAGGAVIGTIAGAQGFGRDSVYARDHSAAAGGGAVGTNVGAQRFGRDSVYASPGGATRVTSTVKTHIVRRLGVVYGRAGGPLPFFNSRPKAG